MMQQQKYIKESNEAWLARSLKEYGAYEDMQGRLGTDRTKRELLMEYVRKMGKGVEGLDRPALAMTPRAKEAGLEGYIPGVNFPQPTVKREKAIAPTMDSLRDITRQFFPENLDIQEAITNLMMTKGSDEALGQMKDYTKIIEAEKERDLRTKALKHEETGLGLRAKELAYKKTGTEKVDKTITKIERARENRNDLMDKISSQTMDNFFESTTKSEKNVIKHILSLNDDIKKYKKETKGYEDPDWQYAEAAKSVKNAGGTRQFLMKALMGGDLTPEEETARETIRTYLDGLGLSLPILMEYF
jgi:hypothetical protein